MVSYFLRYVRRNLLFRKELSSIIVTLEKMYGKDSLMKSLMNTKIGISVLGDCIIWGSRILEY